MTRMYAHQLLVLSVLLFAGAVLLGIQVHHHWPWWPFACGGLLALLVALKFLREDP